jgi:hypothetical protein
MKDVIPSSLDTTTSLITMLILRPATTEVNLKQVVKTPGVYPSRDRRDSKWTPLE